MSFFPDQLAGSLYARKAFQTVLQVAEILPAVVQVQVQVLVPVLARQLWLL